MRNVCAADRSGQRLAAVRTEDALREEAVYDIQQDVVADPQAGRVTGRPGRALRVVALGGFAGVEGQVVWVLPNARRPHSSQKIYKRTPTMKVAAMLILKDRYQPGRS